MSFQATVQPFSMIGTNPITNNSFVKSPENQKELIQLLKTRIKAIKGNEIIGNERGICEYKVDIKRENFLSELQEYAVSLDHDNIDEIYRGTQETRFNHLVQLSNHIGIYLPIFFFFPIHIATKGNPLPIFIGSSIKLAQELESINASLQAKKQMQIDISDSEFSADEEDLEDYEADNEGVKNFWASFSFQVLHTIVYKSIQTKLPLFINN